VELLKVLVALGGKNVRADQLADALWPHVDADYAHKSFTQTLYRLRGYFSDEDAIVLRDGRLSLNSSFFWIDTWALEHLIAEVDAWLRNPDATAAESALKPLMDELILLYAGAFLPDEDEQPSYIACREQFRARLLRIVTRVAHRWEETGRSEAAVDYYLRCIHADELCEPFYRNLMLCYQRRDETADALATYERLRTVLVARLKCIPSPETQKLHASLRSGSGGTF
jgi:DNA-binding SARP family transcriptional activator